MNCFEWGMHEKTENYDQNNSKGSKIPYLLPLKIEKWRIVWKGGESFSLLTNYFGILSVLNLLVTISEPFGMQVSLSR